MEGPVKIDFVVLWVDGNNPEWQARYKQYRQGEHPENTARFRDWGLLPYWFRAVEKYAPWVNKIYFVTSGELPDWLNLNHPKLVHVKHEDFIPAKYLPTFATPTIELNLYLIPGLSEHFVYFNDDMFLNGPVKPTYFFRKGLPCDAPCEKISCAAYYNRKDKWGIAVSDFCNVGVINSHFNRYKTIKQSLYRWFGPYLGFKKICSSLMNSRTQRFVAFHSVHQSQPFLKEIYRDAWSNEYEWLDKTCTYRFREDVSLTQYFLRYWQLASNKFYPQWHNDRLCISLTDGTYFEYVERKLLDEHMKCICLNDTPMCSDMKYNELKTSLTCVFESKFQQKSEFEK